MRIDQSRFCNSEMYFFNRTKHCMLYILTRIWVLGTPKTGQISFFHFSLFWQDFEAKMEKSSQKVHHFYPQINYHNI